ncbi:hypothetical protein, partial [Aeromonas veronii]|uniref:hypothetical protein n=1 Tax=Aeromonas veronii TaxID=654 RepID=UPI001CA5E4B2
PDGKAFFLWAVFAHKTHRFAYQNEYKNPASRPGFCIFSALNHQYLAFPCQVRVLDSQLFPSFSGYIRALSVSFTAI